MATETEERYYEAELHRLRGELILKSVQYSPRLTGGLPEHVSQFRELESEAEAAFRQAIEVARRQYAKSLELRAATSLARLWQAQDKRGEARAMLSEIYSWFTEGSNTGDLQDAKALLTELEA